jgi:hypothetical protein
LTSSNKEGDGAWPGDYKVLVVKQEAGEKAGVERFDPTSGVAPSPEQMQALKQGQGAGQRGMMDKYGPPRKDLLPKIYGDPAKTPLRQSVPVSGEVNLDLKSEGT